MQSGVLAQVLFWDLVWGAVLKCWRQCGQVLWECCWGGIDGRGLGGMQFGVLVRVLFFGGLGSRARLCEIDGGTLRGMQLGALVQVLF